MKIDLSQFQRDHSFYGELNLLLTVKSFDLQAIRKRYLASKKNKRAGSVERRKVAFTEADQKLFQHISKMS